MGIGMLLLVSVLIFVALRVLPGNPTTAMASNPGVTQEQIAQARLQLGIDKPVPVQYIDWLGGVVRGDFGKSYFSGYSTTKLIGQRVWPTIELATAALLIALLIAVPLAVVSAMRPYSLVDKLLGVGASAGMSLPVFWLGVILIWLFAVELRWLPSRGYVSVFDDPVENMRRLLLPAVTLGMVLAAPIMRFLRASLLETLSSAFVRTAEGKGLLWRHVVIRHALPNALLPTLSFIGLLVGSMLGGVVIIEWVFGWPGLGSLAIDAVSKRDYIVLQGVVLLAAAAFIAVTLFIDVLSRMIDPRLELGDA
ncbi:MAG: peptide/nickel transport system permease protein [Solirubrobacteraceae bacterium]